MRTAVLLSGGVDSSVALSLLAREGRDAITAFYLKIWLEDELSHLGACPWEEDLRFAREVCEAAQVPLRVVSLQAEYHERVVSYALAELRAGRTPSPDIFCNQRIKLGVFLDRVGTEYGRVATGHYARVEAGDPTSNVRLLRGVDPVKDQTYFLSHLSQQQVRRCVFPIGGLTKREVRGLAADLGLPNRDRPDSQGICFLGKIPFAAFVRHHLGERPGDIVDVTTGRRLGGHAGYWFYTIGQRRGLGLSQGPWFVVGKDIERNIVHVAHEEHCQRHAVDTYRVAEPHWIGAPPAPGVALQAKVRHSPTTHGCTLTPYADDVATVCLDRPDPGLAPGQFTVFYDGDVCLGGARIV